MPDDTTLTSAESEPLIEVTSEAEPEAAPAQGQASETAAPSTDPREERIKRLEANVKGRQAEAEKYRRRTEELEQTLARYQTTYQPPQPAQPAGPPEPSDEELAKQEQQYLLDGKFSELAQLRRYQREKAAKEAQAATYQMLSQAATVAQSQQAAGRYLAKMGITDMSSEEGKAVMARMQEMTRDPDYQDVAQNQSVLARLAAAEIKALRAESGTKAKEKEREDSADSAATESGKSAGLPPGIRPNNKMYFRPDEMKFINYDHKTKGMSLAEAQKRWWGALGKDEQERRQKQGRA